MVQSKSLINYVLPSNLSQFSLHQLNSTGQRSVYEYGVGVRKGKNSGKFWEWRRAQRGRDVYKHVKAGESKGNRWEVE